MSGEKFAAEMCSRTANIEIRRELWRDLWPDIEPLLRANHEEAGTSAWRPWRVDASAMAQAEAAGILGIWVARAEASKLGASHPITHGLSATMCPSGPHDSNAQVARLRPRTSEGADPAGARLPTANLPARQDDALLPVRHPICGFIMWALQGDVESRGLIVAQQLAWYASPAAPTRTAMRLFIESVAELRQRGVAGILAHERFEGRGRHIGRWLRRMGAEPYATVYAMGIQG